MMINYETFMLFLTPRSRFDAIQYRLTMMLLKVKFMKVPKNMKNGSVRSEDSQNYFESRAASASAAGRNGSLTIKSLHLNSSFSLLYGKFKP